MIVMHPHDGSPFFCGNCGAPEWECRCKTFALESVAMAQARKIAFDASMRSDEKLENRLRHADTPVKIGCSAPARLVALLAIAAAALFLFFAFH